MFFLLLCHSFYTLLYSDVLCDVLTIFFYLFICHVWYSSRDLGLTGGGEIMKKRQIHRHTEILSLGGLFSLMVVILQHPQSSAYISCAVELKGRLWHTVVQGAGLLHTNKQGDRVYVKQLDQDDRFS